MRHFYDYATPEGQAQVEDLVNRISVYGRAMVWLRWDPERGELVAM